MYAIIKSGGKQYRVKQGDVIDIELIEGEVGAEILFSDVLFMNDGKTSKVGAPNISGTVVHAEMIGQSKGPKITSLKYKPRQYRKFGHRQHYSRVKITKIDHSKSK